MSRKTQPASHESETASNALFALAAECGWNAVSLADIAARAKLPMAELVDTYGGKAGIVRAYRRRLDHAVLSGGPPGSDETARDRLFDVVMLRFDAMQANRDGLRAMARDIRWDPWWWLSGPPRLARTAAILLEAAGISASGPRGRLKIRGMAMVYAATLRTWLADDTPDMAKTMASLDRALGRAEGLATLLWRRGGASATGGNSAAEP